MQISLLIVWIALAEHPTAVFAVSPIHPIFGIAKDIQKDLDLLCALDSI